jgi:hypothetical protein
MFSNNGLAPNCMVILAVVIKINFLNAFLTGLVI